MNPTVLKLTKIDSTMALQPWTGGTCDLCFGRGHIGRPDGQQGPRVVAVVAVVAVAVFAPCGPGVPQAAAAVAAKLQDSDAKVANAAWAAIRKRLGDADPDVNRVWLEEVHCNHLNPSVRGEAGQDWWL